MLAGWAACALAVLSKGLIGIVLPARDRGALHVGRGATGRCCAGSSSRAGGALFLAITAPWFVAVSLAQSASSRISSSCRSISSASPPRCTTACTRRGISSRCSQRRRRAVARACSAQAWWAALRTPRARASRRSCFLALWALVVFVFFSASGSKLPALHPADWSRRSLCSAAPTWRAPRRGAARGAVGRQALLGLALAAAAPRLARSVRTELDPFAGAYSAALIAAGLALAAAGVYAAVLARRGTSGSVRGRARRRRVLRRARRRSPGIASMRPPSASRTIAALTRAAAGSAVLRGRQLRSHVPWSLRRTVTMVGLSRRARRRGRLGAGQVHARRRRLRRAWTERARGVALFARARFRPAPRELGVPMEVVARGPRYVIVRKP